MKRHQITTDIIIFILEIEKSLVRWLLRLFRGLRGQLRCILPQSNTCAWVCACDANREPQWLHWSYFDDPRVKAWFMGEFWVPRRLDMVGANFQWNLQWRGKFSARKKTVKICPDSEDFAENFVTRWQRLTNHFTRHVAQIFSEIFSGIFDYP